MRLLFDLAVYCCIAAVALAAFFRPRWSVPLFLAVFPLFSAKTMVASVEIGESPVTHTSMAVCAFGAGFFLRKSNWTALRSGIKASPLPIVFWIALLLTSIPGLLIGGGDDEGGPLIRAMYFAGVMCPILVYLIALSWTARFFQLNMLAAGAIAGLLIGVVLSLAVQPVVGQTNMLLTTKLDASRYNVFSYGNANFYGFILALIYPIVLTNLKARRTYQGWSWMTGAIVMWVLAVTCYSRAAVVVLALQTLGWLFLERSIGKRGKLIVIMLAAAVLGAILAPERLSILGDRFAVLFGAGVSPDLAEAENERIDRMQMALEAIQRNPFGDGDPYVDRESLFLTTANQFGVISALILLLILLHSFRRNWFPKGTTGAYLTTSRILALSSGGAIIYGFLAGAKLAHLSACSTGLTVQSACSVYMALVAGFYLPRLTVPAGRASLVESPRVPLPPLDSSPGLRAHAHGTPL